MDPSFYLDFNATSPLSQSVQDWLKSGDVLFANPSSQHSLGKASRKAINQAKEEIYHCFKQDEKKTRLLFHSGATESFSMMAYSFSEWARLSGKDLLICYSKTDHPAVTSLSERYFGPHVKFLELKRDGTTDYQHQDNLKVIQDKKENNPDLMILYHHLWVHNETGLVSPLKELQIFKHIPDLYIHVDAVQAPGKIVDWQELKIGDIYTFSAHKFGALKGIGFSFISSQVMVHSLISGGGQQGNLRSGTENVSGIQSIALALRDLMKVDVKGASDICQIFERELAKLLAGKGEIISSRAPLRNANTIYFYLNNLTSDIALAMFDLEGLCLSAGSACSSGAAKASPVLTDLGLKEVARHGLRISFGPNLHLNDLKIVQAKFQKVLQKIN